MKIFVIGNGFDLHCGLKSRFSDFYDSVMKNEDGKYIASKIRSNIWYLLLYFRFIKGIKDGVCELLQKDSVLWMDVEEFISSVLNGTTGFASGHPLISINNAIASSSSGSSNIDSFNHILYSSYNDQYNEVISLINKKNKGKGALNLLMSELVEFENEFSEYLKRELSTNLVYRYSAKDFVKQIGEETNTFVINFNYTKGIPYKNTISVHGSLDDKDIIIGTDVSSINNKNKYSLRFSKAWRKIASQTKATKIPDKETIDEIIFYGHSLSPQDYSYFHALFNYYDIYGSSVVLTFLYSDYEYVDEKRTIPNKEKNEINRFNYIDKIFSLLTDYVEKTHNSFEANSIITKIQLENRLRILKVE